MAKLACDLEQTFIRFRAAVGKKNFAHADALHEFSREPALWLGEIKIRDVDEFLGLLDERFDDSGCA